MPCCMSFGDGKDFPTHQGSRASVFLMTFLGRKLSLFQRHSAPGLVLVYQMGRVGSTALAHSLPGSIHIHSLYGNMPCYVHDQQIHSSLPRRLNRTANNLLKRAALRSVENLKIISLVRDPLARNISMFFLNLPHWLYHYYGITHADSRDSGPELLTHAFEKVFDHAYPLSWFDVELSRFLGQDILAHQFDPARGYAIYELDKARVFLAQHEALGSLIGPLSEFCQTDITLQQVNATATKWYKCLLEDFTKIYRPPASYLDLLYNSRVVRHFYNETQISQFRARAVSPKDTCGPI